MSDRPVSGDGHRWPVAPRYAPDLFAGLARDYARHRPPYPPELLDDLCTRAAVTGTGDLLDLACGTGQIALALHDRFRAVVAVDQEPDMVAMGREVAAGLGAPNLDWAVGRAEDVDFPPGRFELITIGNAFHRVSQHPVARRAYGWLRPGSGFAVMGGSGLWTGAAPWRDEVLGAVRRWLEPAGERSRDQAGPDAGGRRMSPDDVLREAGFARVERHEFDVRHTWTVEAFLGYLRSTSLLGAVREAEARRRFEAEVHAILAGYARDGAFGETVNWYYVLARRPTGT